MLNELCRSSGTHRTLRLEMVDDVSWRERRPRVHAVTCVACRVSVVSDTPLTIVTVGYDGAIGRFQMLPGSQRVSLSAGASAPRPSANAYST